MTVLRREDVQSRVASWDGRPYRIASSPILTIVPLIIRRLRGPSPNRVMVRSPTALRARRSLTRRHRCRLECGPQKARQLARNGNGDLRRGLMVFRQASESPTQSLLRFVGNRDHTAWLAFAASRERRPDAWPMLIVPRGFDQQPTDQRVARSRDAPAALLVAARILARHEADVRHPRTKRLQSPKVMQLGKYQNC